MSPSALFIRRPVATILLSVAITLAGLFAYRQLPVAALPQVDFPTVSVSAQLPGASPETMANAVATPLIKQFSTIPAIQQISTTSSQGSTSIVIEFELDRDIDEAAADVQAAIARTQRQLPVEMTTPPSYRKLNPADAPILLLALTSATTPLPTLDAFAAAGDLAGAVDDRRRRPGPGLRQPALRRARSSSIPTPWPRAASASTSSRTRWRRPTSTRRSARSRAKRRT